MNSERLRWREASEKIHHSCCWAVLLPNGRHHGLKRVWSLDRSVDRVAEGTVNPNAKDANLHARTPRLMCQLNDCSPTPCWEHPCGSWEDDQLWSIIDRDASKFMAREQYVLGPKVHKESPNEHHYPTVVGLQDRE